MSRRIQRQRPLRAASILLASVVATAGCRDLPDGLSVSRQGAVQRSIDESRRTAIVNAVEIAASAVVSVNATVRQRIVPRSRFDALFLRLMTRHHEGGIMMARAAQQHARLSVVRRAARAMQVEQAEEIAQMQGLALTTGGSRAARVAPE